MKKDGSRHPLFFHPEPIFYQSSYFYFIKLTPFTMPTFGGLFREWNEDFSGFVY